MAIDPLAPHSLTPADLQKVLAAERLGLPFLAFRDSERRLVIASLAALGRPLTIGREPGVDLSIAGDSELSALHAQLEFLGGQWIIVDDGLSRNGTYVNHERISGRRRLRDGDRVRVGQTIIAFRRTAVQESIETKPAVQSALLPQLSETQRRLLTALCRPYRNGPRLAAPATNKQIAEEIHLSTAGVKMQLRKLFTIFEIGPLPQNQKRARLAESALQLGVVDEHDLS